VTALYAICGHIAPRSQPAAMTVRGAKPGKRSNGWSEYHPAAVTCPKCLAKLAKESAK
jgi:hypothetical protein